MKHIAYIGNFSVDFSTESHISATLEALGHRVTRLQENAVTAEGVARTLLAAVHTDPVDLLLWTRTGHWLRGDAAEMLAVARRLEIPTAAYHLDLYAGLQRHGDVDTSPWWRCDWVFTADGGSDDFWRARGIRHVWMPPGVYLPECYIAAGTGASGEAPFEYDVVFVGQYHYHPEWPYRQRLIDWLRSAYGDRFRQFGHDGVPVRGDALNRLYASAKVVVGDSLCLGFSHPRYWSDRVPETMGRGGFLIMPYIVGLGDYCRADEEIVFYSFGNFDELRGHIDHYLAADAEREAIRRAGHEAVKRHSTYHHRMSTMLATIFGEGL